MRINFFELVSRLSKCNSISDFALMVEDLDSIKESLTTDDYCEIAKQVSRFKSIASVSLLMSCSTECLRPGLTLHLKKEIQALIAKSNELNRLCLSADKQYAHGRDRMREEALMVTLLEENVLYTLKDFVLRHMNSIPGLNKILSWEDIIDLKAEISCAQSNLETSLVSKTAGT